MTARLFERYDEGHISKALSQLRQLGDHPAAQALVALTENRVSDVLSYREDSDDVMAWYLRAIAAWRLGDTAALRHAVSRAVAVATEEEAEQIDELSAFLEIAEAATTQRIRVATDNGAISASFDPSRTHVVCDMTLNGEMLQMIVDTGAEMPLIDQGVAERIGVRFPSSRTVAAGTNTGEVAMSLGLVDAWQWLGISWRDVPVLAVDLAHMRRKLGCDGVMGVQDLLSHFALRIDYTRGETTRLQTSRAEGWPLFFTQGRTLISVEGRMDGGSTGLFRIDTGGAKSGLTKEYLAASLAQDAAWDVSEEVSEVRKVVTEQIRQRRYVKQLRFHPADSSESLLLHDVPVDTTMADDLIAYAGKLGADAFAGRVLELDYPACRLRLSSMQ